MNKINEKLPPPKKMRLRKKAQEKEDEIKRKIYKANQAWNHWNFQMHWNKFEWVNPRSREERFVCLLWKKNIKTEHLVGHLQLRSLDVDNFFKTTPFVDYIKASVNGNRIKKSASEKKSIFIIRRRRTIIRKG